jgi:hypothetical protein
MTDDSASADGSTLFTRRNIVLFLSACVILFILMQFARFIVPSLKIENPPSTYTVEWDSPQTQTLWNETCGDCHSNDTVWPWYSYIAPIGWLVAHDVHDGRDHVNISTDQIYVGEMIEAIREGEMPPAIYKIRHSNARLDDTEKSDLIAGLQATFGSGS